MNFENLDFGNDKYIGEAILAVMFFFMFVWLTSSVSPIHYPNADRINAQNLVSHLEVILIVVIPFALLGLVQSLRPSAVVRTSSNSAAERLSSRAREYRKAHGRAKYRKAKDDKDRNA